MLKPTHECRNEKLGLRENNFKELLEGPSNISTSIKEKEDLKRVEDLKEKPRNNLYHLI